MRSIGLRTSDLGRVLADIVELAVRSAEQNLGSARLLLGIQDCTDGFLGGSPAVIPYPVKEHHVLGGFLKLGEIVHSFLDAVLDSIAVRNSIGQHARPVCALPPEDVGGQLLLI